MIVIPPLEITAGRLTSSTVLETIPAVYAGGTTYALGATCSVAGTAGAYTIYESLQNGNTGNVPASSPTWWQSLGISYQAYNAGTTYAENDYVTDTTNHIVYISLASSNVGNALTDTTWWLEVDYSNRWRMFQYTKNTASSVPRTMTIVITPGVRVDSLALKGIVATTVDVTVTDGGTPVYTYHELLTARSVGGWYDYFFMPFTAKTSLLLTDLPPYASNVITVELDNGTDDVELVALVLGTKVYIGATQYSADNDVLNFSSVTRDFAGGINEMVQRRNVPKTSQTIHISKDLVNRARNVRDALNAIPAVWSGLDDTSDGYFEALNILGFYRRFSINVAQPDHAIITLELEEI